ncbi:class I SAM-dependent methyltransferase [Paractinoplanes maris]|uniref:class I SAM-dependent methyltransferase n=1 Tax=Paractinoplanes maris TaxID=1734446 RepID=UPI00202100C9|nr:class I SAM-dependent methyltransferase [Actinoplanes maris]
MISAGYDAELRRHQEVLRRAWGIGARDHVLDLGCGAGLTTREAARAASAGSALGVDISAPAIERARELARAEGVPNVSFACADVQEHDFGAGRFDVAISRFGTMFFGDPAAAFAGVGRALRPGGRLVMLVWQDGALNEWHVVIRRALGEPPVAGRGAFSLGDRAGVTAMLSGAGFEGVAFADVDEPLYYGPDVAAALDWVRNFAPAAAGTAELRETMLAHTTDDGVWLGSRAWLVTARKGQRPAARIDTVE